MKTQPEGQTPDLDALPEEPQVVESMRGPYGGDTIRYIDALRAHCQRNIEARNAAEEAADAYSKGVFSQTMLNAAHAIGKHKALKLELAEAKAELAKMTDAYSIAHKQVMSNGQKAMEADAKSRACQKIAWDWGQGVDDAEKLPEGDARDAARYRWLAELFERKWDGTIGRPSTYHLRGDYRHVIGRLSGVTLDAAIDAAMQHSPAKEGKS
jgi:hypothetical protein